MVKNNNTEQKNKLCQVYLILIKCCDAYASQHHALYKMYMTLATLA